MQQNLGNPQPGLLVQEDKPKKKKGISVSFFVIFMIFWGVLTFGAGGYVWFRYSDYLDRLIPVETQEKVKIQKVVEEKPVYFSQIDEERYIDKDSASEIFSELLLQARESFNFEYAVDDPTLYKDYEEFILVNMENQLARLEARFDLDLQLRIDVVLVNDFQKFKDDMELEIDEEPSLMAYSSKGQLIEIFMPESRPTMDKFVLASTVSHELVHVFQYHKYVYIFEKKANLIWLYEGMAEYWSYPKEDSLVKRDIQKDIKSLNDLNTYLTSGINDDLTIGYAVSEQFFGYLNDTYGEDLIIEILNDSLSDNIWRKDFVEVFKEKTNILPEQAFQVWLNSI